MKAVWWVGLALVMAGCSNDPAAPAPPEDEEFKDLTATATTGVIRGVVFDETIAPVAGVTVRLSSTGATSQTSDTGAFAFQDVKPGIQFLEATKPGFRPVQQSVEVVAGVDAPPMVKMQLARQPGTEPTAVYLQYTGYIGCAFKAANVVFPNQCAAVGDPDVNEVLNFDRSDIPQLVQTEIVWKHTQEFARMLGTIQYVVRDDDSTQRVGNVWGPSPLVCTVTPEAVCRNADGTGGGGEGLNESEFPGRYFASVYAACYMQCVPGTALGAGIIVQQDYTLVASAFFNYRPPEGWTLTRDGEYPAPA